MRVPLHVWWKWGVMCGDKGLSCIDLWHIYTGTFSDKIPTHYTIHCNILCERMFYMGFWNYKGCCQSIVPRSTISEEFFTLEKNGGFPDKFLTLIWIPPPLQFLIFLQTVFCNFFTNLMTSFCQELFRIFFLKN